jgi:hypothetical protein
MYQYSDKSKKKYIKKGGKRLEIEIIFNPAQTLSHLRDKIISDMRQITKLAWADFGYVVSQWFDWASILLIVRYRGEIVGFSANEFLDGNVVVFLSTMILPNFQNMGLSKTLQRFAFKQFLLINFKFKFLTLNFEFFFINPLGPLYSSGVKLASRSPSTLTMAASGYIFSTVIS